MPDPFSAALTVLESGEAPYSCYNPTGQSGLVLVCDHARNTIPRQLGTLGLPPTVLATHIALDIGCEALAIALADRFDSVLVIAGFSRLVVDLNRPPGHPASIPQISDGIEIPGNQDLSERERLGRIEEIFSPYHKAVSTEVGRACDRHPQVALVSMHSFTPRMDGQNRPWHIGILWNHDQRLSQPLLESLRRDSGLCVGDNQPYDARAQLGYTVDTFAHINSLAQVMIEVRQDLLESEEGVLRWAGLLSEHLKGALANWGVLIDR
ncbi:MAG TPA: N-formylglutamate amidohydrolase [Gammaproteobacteria bacterium]|nr:N-formylglutamate amidohydrolase [Gammaproteobacteria bacterium]